MNKHFNPDPSRSLAYHSLLEDERERFAHPVTLSKTPRDNPFVPTNGNLRTVIPDIDKPEVRSNLAAHYNVDTSTRTIFNNDKFYDIRDTMADRAADPTIRCNAPKFNGHKAMNTMATFDPRQQHMPPPTHETVGPGTYNTDPSGLVTTGSPPLWSEGQSHHTTPLHKDPARPSAAFKSPERGKTHEDLAFEKQRTGGPAYFRPPDFASWTHKGMYIPQGDRKIEAEKWGKSLREPRPPPLEANPEYVDISYLEQEEEKHQQLLRQKLARSRRSKSPDKSNNKGEQQGKSGDAKQAKDAPQAAFASTLPRLMAAPAQGKKSDTRLRVKSHNDLYGTSSALGPGSFQTDVARFKSWNIGHLNAVHYMPQGTSLDKMHSPGGVVDPALVAAASPSATTRALVNAIKTGTMSAPVSPTSKTPRSPVPPLSPSRLVAGVTAMLSPSAASGLASPTTRVSAFTGLGSPHNITAGSPKKPMDINNSNSQGNVNAALSINVPPGAGNDGRHQGHFPGDDNMYQHNHQRQGFLDDVLYSETPAFPDKAHLDDEDWKLHVAAVSATYAETDDLRGALTLAARQSGVASPEPMTVLLPTGAAARTYSGTSSYGSQQSTGTSTSGCMAVNDGQAGNLHCASVGAISCPSPTTDHHNPAGGGVAGGVITGGTLPAVRALSAGSHRPVAANAAVNLKLAMAQDAELVFNRRSKLHKVQVKAQLRAVADLKAARKAHNL